MAGRRAMSYTQPAVYLAGPITGLSYDATTDWRAAASKALGAHGILGISPMRCKEFLAGARRIAGSYEDGALGAAAGIYTRDRHDIRQCDAVLMNLLGVSSPTIGCMIELGWADAFSIPVVLVIEREQDTAAAASEFSLMLRQHPFVSRIAGYRLPTLEAGLDVVIAVVKP